jgi:AraC-like DNA-binding protein
MLVVANETPTRVVHHRSSLGEWELAIRRPDPRLQPYVTEYEGYRETAAPAVIKRREVPWPGVVLIINFGPAFRISDPRVATGPADYYSFVAGLSESWAVVESIGRSYCMQVNFTPLGARRFFRLPMHEIANRAVHMEDVLGVQGEWLREQLAECPDWDARFALLETFIATRLSGARPPTAEIAWAWHQLQLRDGNRPIGLLAKELGWSPKRLIAEFRQEIGLPPRALARIIRFNRVIRWLDGRDEVRWAALAHRAGYFDQAHFNRDFRELAGRTPGEFFRRRVAGGGNMED